MTGRHVVLLVVDAGEEEVGGHDLLQPQNDLMAMSASPLDLFLMFDLMAEGIWIHLFSFCVSLHYASTREVLFSTSVKANINAVQVWQATIDLIALQTSTWTCI